MEDVDRKGIILAGGAGTRLHPLTLVTSKQLLPVYDKPMIYYPLCTLMLAGIRDILVITTPWDQAGFRRLLGSGEQWGVRFEFATQPSPDGIAQAFVIAEHFIRGHRSVLVLGDNILYGHGLPDVLRNAVSRPDGATVFAYHVDNPHQYGIVSFDDTGRPSTLEEKPREPRSDWALIGLYLYDETVVERAKALTPSARGEYEITDLSRSYLDENRLRVERLGRGFAWFDAGTHPSLLEAADFVGILQRRQAQLISSPEEVAYTNGWIDAAQVARAARKYKNEYGAALMALLDTSPQR